MIALNQNVFVVPVSSGEWCVVTGIPDSSKSSPRIAYLTDTPIIAFHVEVGFGQDGSAICRYVLALTVTGGADAVESYGGSYLLRHASGECYFPEEGCYTRMGKIGNAAILEDFKRTQKNNPEWSAQL